MAIAVNALQYYQLQFLCHGYNMRYMGVCAPIDYQSRTIMLRRALYCTNTNQYRPIQTNTTQIIYVRCETAQMDSEQIQRKMHSYYLTAIASVIFAVVGFSYNAWRMEASENNSNLRTAAFQIILELAEFEQILYSAHYDKDPIEGSPRKAWVKVGLVNELSMLMHKPVQDRAQELVDTWQKHWPTLEEKTSIDVLVKKVDALRTEIRNGIEALD
ncbi:MAG: hypothetical protein ACI93R_002622 [Flavobacteriales bacterium]|jgi:hypothetical protein